jgi:hypothetical protein
VYRRNAYLYFGLKTENHRGGNQYGVLFTNGKAKDLSVGGFPSYIGIEVQLVQCVIVGFSW